MLPEGSAKAEAMQRQLRLKARIKLYVMLWQIVSVLPFTLEMNFPHVYQSKAAVLNVFNLGISVSSLVTCSTNSHFDAIDNLVFSTVYPVVFVAVLWLVQKAHTLIQRGKDAETLTLIHSRYFSVFLVFTYLILPFISVIIFHTFSCQHVDPDDVEAGDDSYLATDYSVSCSSSKYRFGYAWAIGSIFVYPIGIPLYYYYILYHSREDILSRLEHASDDEKRNRDARLLSIRLLFQFYKPACGTGSWLRRCSACS